MDTTIQELQFLNLLFLENNKKKNQANHKNYLFKKGEIPILLSAPHAVGHYREGQYKVHDYLTGPLAIYIAEKCHCSYLVRTFNNDDDPNYPLGTTLQNPTDAYLLELQKIIQEHKILLVIDIHGCGDHKQVDCSIWSNQYQTCPYSLISILHKHLKQANFSTDDGQEYLGGQVTRQSSLLTNAFQIEIKRKIRTTEKDIFLLDAYIKAMVTAITEIHHHLSS